MKELMKERQRIIKFIETLNNTFLMIASKPKNWECIKEEVFKEIWISELSSNIDKLAENTKAIEEAMKS